MKRTFITWCYLLLFGFTTAFVTLTALFYGLFNSLAVLRLAIASNGLEMLPQLIPSLGFMVLDLILVTVGIITLTKLHDPSPKTQYWAMGAYCFFIISAAIKYSFPDPLREHIIASASSDTASLTAEDIIFSGIFFFLVLILPLIIHLRHQQKIYELEAQINKSTASML